MRKEEKAAAELLSSGKLDPEKLLELGESRDGQKVRAMLGDGRALSEAIQKGDAETVRRALQDLLATPEGRRLFERLGGMMGKK